MTTYIPLGPRGPLTGVLDTTQRNIGNWTVTFSPNELNCNIPIFEVSHIVIHGAANSTFNVFIDLHQWSTAQNGNINEWDPQVPMYLFPGQYLYFFWSDPATDGTPPTVEMWLRYDQDIIANQKAISGRK